MKWHALTLGGGLLNGAIKRGTDKASGAYAIRRKDSGSVVYVGVSFSGRMWRTIMRHFQTDNFRRDLPRFERRSDYEITWRVTSRGERVKGDHDPKAKALESAWIAKWGKAGEGEPLKNIRENDNDAFDFGHNVEGAFDSVLNPGARFVVHARSKRAGVALCGAKRSEGHTGTASTGAKRGVVLAGPGEIVNCQRCSAASGAAVSKATSGARRAELRTSGARAGELWRSSFLPFAAPLRDASSAATAAARSSGLRGAEASAFEDSFVEASRQRHDNPAPRVLVAPPPPVGLLVELGLLTRLTLGAPSSVVFAWSLRDAPVLAYDEAGRLFVVYAGPVVAASSVPALKEYKRTHWGKSGKGDVRNGGLAPSPFADLGPAVSITYTTRKGFDSELVDYVHPFGEGSSRRCIFPRVLIHEGAGSGKGAIALSGGSYTVESRGIVG